VAAFSAHTNELVILAEVDFAARSAADTRALDEAIRVAVLREHALFVSEICLLRPTTLPITSSGKIRRRHGRELYERGMLTLFQGNAQPAGPCAAQ
jgi:acyl-CoA synthetase (AMP-forming)/AMP-acid ligase II